MRSNKKVVKNSEIFLEKNTQKKKKTRTHSGKEKRYFFLLKRTFFRHAIGVGVYVHYWYILGIANGHLLDYILNTNFWTGSPNPYPFPFFYRVGKK